MSITGKCIFYQLPEQDELYLNDPEKVTYSSETSDFEIDGGKIQV